MKKQNATCPICDASMSISKNTEVSEILICPDCHSKIVVEEIGKEKIVLSQAPEIEEDWGE